jgi:hypothetical protein
MRNAKLAAVVTAIRDFMAKDPDASVAPERVAMEMYLLNHAYAKVQQTRAPYEPLPEAENQLVDLYFRRASVSAVRGFYYLLLICQRESLHLKNKEVYRQEMKAKFGGPAAKLVGTLSDNSADVAGVAIGPVVEALRWQFYNGSYNGGYGGKAWGQVNDPLVHFVNGEYSAEMMMDTIWTLCHNNGPIFNKGMLFGHYSTGGKILLRILDLQRAGQVPEGVLHDPSLAHWRSHELVGVAQKIKALWGCGDYVDWYAVEALGAQQSYPTDKKQQAQLHGEPAHIAELKAQQDAAKKAQAEAVKAQYFEVMPGVKIKKVARAA